MRLPAADMLNATWRGPRFAAVFTVALTLIAGCGPSDSLGKSQDIIGAVTPSGISPDRCAENRKAGEITYLTGYDFASAAGIIDAVVADQLGFFEKMCLDVKLKSGLDSSNIPLVSTGKVQFSVVGSMSQVADGNDRKGGNLQAIGVLGHQAIEELVVSSNSGIQGLSDVSNTTMGVVNSIPFSVRVMLVNAGVRLDSVRQINAGFNPLSIDEGAFSSRPVYKSNEPRQLDMAKIDYKVFDPASFGVAASFAVIVVNKDFARAHPSATEDLLRAQLHGLRYAMEHPDEAVDWTYKRSDPKYFFSPETERFRWAMESALVRESTPTGRNYGYIDAGEVRKEIEPLVTKVKSLPQMPVLDRLYDTRFVASVYNGKELIWPEGVLGNSGVGEPVQ